MAHIALFVPSLKCGGAERVMTLLAKGFVHKGHQVDMVLANAEGEYLSELEPGISIIDLNKKRVLFSLPGLIKYLRNAQPQVLLSTLDHANVIALFAKQLCSYQVKVVVRVANTMSVLYDKEKSFKNTVIVKLLKCLYAGADKVIAVSNGVAEDFIRYMNANEQKVAVVYNPVVTPDLYEKALQPNNHPWLQSGMPPVVLSVGRLAPQKDFATLLKAFAIVKQRLDARLLIIGEGDLHRQLQIQINNLGLTSSVELHGFVLNPFSFMKLAKVFVLSSQWEGLPNALIQALALGTKVVATDCPSGPLEILEQGKWGKLVPVGDEKAMAQAIFCSLREQGSPDTAKRGANFGLEQSVDGYLSALGIGAIGDPKIVS
jgi:glycosyltransferase involved in cell wall biosynthesis